MKIARVVLTATILLSLKSTLFCSEKESNLIRRKSFDIFVDGWNKDGNWQMDNYGTEFNGKEVRIESRDSQRATKNWGNYGKTIQDLPRAKKFINAITSAQLQLPAEALKPAQDLIDAENQRLKQIKQEAEAAKKAARDANIAKMHEINQSAISDLATHHIKHLLKDQEDKDLLQKHQQRLVAATMSCNIILKQEQTKIEAARSQEKTDLIDKLRKNLNAINEIQAAEGIITYQEKFVRTEDSLSRKKIASLAAKYQDGKPKATSFAEATQGTK